MIFNQCLLNDQKAASRFFVHDAEMQWKMSVRHECFICDKYPITMIFYERGVMAQNTGLIEILDESILKELKYEYQRNKWDYRTATPLISGSVVNRGPGYHLFERKLKMLRLPLFSLLSVI